MRKNILASSAAIILVLAIAGCDWGVQNRIPDDINEGNGSATGTSTDTSENAGNGGAGGTTTQSPANQGGQGNEGDTAGQGGEQQSETGGTTGSSETGGTTGSSETGGTAGSSGTGGQGAAPQNSYDIAFEIPDGWYWMDDKHRTAAKGDPANIRHYGVADGKIEVWGLKDGTDVDARNAILAEHAKNQSECAKQASSCEAPPEYREVTVGAIVVYAAISPPEYANIRTSYAMFSKNGKMLSLTVYDDIDNQMPLLEKVVTTIGW